LKSEIIFIQLPLDAAGLIICRSTGEVKLGGKMKYAIVEDGGKQFRAVEGSTIDVDYLVDAEVGDEMDLEKVLLVVNEDKVQVGKPLVEGVVVQAHVVEQVKGPKIIVFRYRPKKRYRVKTGHRQKYTRILIDSITVE
jgi:large subunit ribosomal protein L21